MFMAILASPFNRNWHGMTGTQECAGMECVGTRTASVGLSHGPVNFDLGFLLYIEI